MCRALSRESALDVEVSASGFTKQMEKDLLVGMGVDNEDESDQEEEIDCVSEEEQSENIEIEELRKHVDQIIIEDEDKTRKGTSLAVSCSSTVPATKESDTGNSSCELLSGEVPTGQPDIPDGADTNHKLLHTRLASECDSDVFSIRSARTNGLSTASTIAPDVIKKRVQVALDKREKQAERKRVLAKGEASAVTRSRRDNAKTIQESHGVWGWD